MKLFTKYILLFGLIAFLLLNLFNTLTHAENQIGMKVTPAYFEYDVIGGEKIQDNIKIESVELNNPQIEIKYLEAKSSNSVYEESELLKKIASLNRKLSSLNKLEYEMSIDTQILSEGTYFFGISFFLNNIKEDGGQRENLSVIIPVIITVNANKDSSNPIPQIWIEMSQNIFFSTNDIQFKLNKINNSNRMIYSSGEIILLSGDNHLLYSEGIISENGRLFPKESISKIISPPPLSSPNADFLPYIGKAKVYYRGVINNERHIETVKKEIFILPWQYIVFLLVLISTVTVPFSIVRQRQKKNQAN